MPEQKSWLTTSEMRAEFHVSPDTLRRLRKSGKLDGRRFGRQIIYLRRSVETFLSGGAPAASQFSERPLRALPVVPRTIR